LKFELCDFWEFFEFSKRRRAVPLRPICTIMVAAKLDQSGVLVTKFHQNRLTLKGRSAGQRHTDRQTHRQTRLKIMALQVCNRANKLNLAIWSRTWSADLSVTLYSNADLVVLNTSSCYFALLPVRDKHFVCVSNARRKARSCGLVVELMKRRTVKSGHP